MEGATLKLRITDLGGAVTPFIGWRYSDGMDIYTLISFNWVAERSAPFEVTKWVEDYNLALKDAIELDLVPSGEWTVTADDFYLYIKSNVPGRIINPFLVYNTVVSTAEIYDSGETPDPVTYIQSLESGAILNAFNDNVIRFSVDLNKVNVTANGQLPITLYPSPLGEYYLNLKDFATTLINENKFADSIVPDIEVNGYTIPDPSLFLSMEVVMNEGLVTSRGTYYFLKSVAQIAGYFEKNISNNYIFIASGKATYYEGYPFDIPIFASAAQSMIIHNKTTGHSVAMDVARFTNRLFFSQGSANFTIEDDLPLQTGINRLELEFSPLSKLDLIINKKESKCAPYFKFYRNGGGYGYIRFESEVGVKNSAQEGESIRMDFNGIQNTIRRYITEKDTKVTMELQTESLEAYEMENFQDFISSPNVEMYVGDLFQKQTEKSWMGVSVATNSMSTKKPKAAKLKEKISIEFDLYNLHL